LEATLIVPALLAAIPPLPGDEAVNAPRLRLLMYGLTLRRVSVTLLNLSRRLVPKLELGAVKLNCELVKLPPVKFAKGTF